MGMGLEGAARRAWFDAWSGLISRGAKPGSVVGFRCPGQSPDLSQKQGDGSEWVTTKAGEEADSLRE